MKPEAGARVYARMINIDDLPAMFERHEAEFIEFKRIQTPRHPRPDIAAFLLLHELVPEDPEYLARVGHASDMVSAAEHDQIWLATDVEKFAQVATEEHVIELLRCGVNYCEDHDSFFMFV